MRKDLHQVIVDEPRRGSRWISTFYKGVRRAKHFKLDNDYEIVNDDFGHRVSMKAGKFRLYYKTFGDHVTPLYRSLEAQVGRPWNDVFSDLCRFYDRRSMVGLHVHQHLRDRINRNVYFNEEGKVCAYSRGRGELAPWRLYVDSDGILRRASDVNGNVSWKTISRERKKRYAEERREIERFFDRSGNERNKEVPVIKGDLNSGGIAFKFEKSGENHKHYNGETEAWFKYHYVVVERIRKICIGYEERFGHEYPIYRYESYKDLEKVRDSASKAEIKKYGLNS